MNREHGPSFEFAAPIPVVFGSGIAAGIPAQVALLAPAARQVLLVHDPALAPIAKAVAVSLAEAGLEVEAFSNFAGEPRDTDVDRAAARVGDTAMTCVVGMGGGSALDIAKLAACVGAGTLATADYSLMRHPVPAGAPLLLVPTTAGTGAELTRTAIFVDGNGRKQWAWGERLRAGRVLLDPGLTTGLPAMVTLHTGLDALVHAIEACTGRRRNPFTDALCLHAVRLVVRALPCALSAPDDLQARGDMLVAAALAGIAIDQCGTGIAHALGHALGGLAGVPHGRAVALSLLATAGWSARSAEAVFAPVILALGGSVERGIDHALRAFVEPLGLDLALPAGLDFTRLAEIAAAPEQAPMRDNSARRAGNAELVELACALAAMGEPHRLQTPARQG